MGLDKARLKNKHIFCTYVAMMPSERNIYIALTINVFQNSISKWFGSVHDCYVLKRSFVEKPFEQFATTNILNLTKDSDKSQDVALWKISKYEEDAIDAMSQWRKATVRIRAVHIECFISVLD